MAQAIRRLATRAGDLLFPRALCLLCGEPRRIDVGDVLCDACAQELEGLRLTDSVCPHCLSPLGSGPCPYCACGGMIGLDAAYAPFFYHGPVQRLVVLLKFGAVDAAAEPLAVAMAECVGGRVFDALTPVPLHPKRLRERGVNQAELLCSLIHRHSGLPVVNALVRTRHTKRQSALTPAAREKNVAAAFAPAAPVQGMSLLLVDDVRTSGNTARACAKVLREAGAAEVCLLTAAVAHQRKGTGRPEQNTPAPGSQGSGSSCASFSASLETS